MEPLVPESSVVRQIWASTDVVFFIFAGSAAEFALNRQVDWLYFTGELPADPIGRLFSTVNYARQIIFADREETDRSISKINAIHHAVETDRGRQIPPEAYKDVLYMLIHYSIAAFELLERKLNEEEKNEVVTIFSEVGRGMGMNQLPPTYAEWQQEYQQFLRKDLAYSNFTADLFKQYRKHLGPFRYFLLIEIQKMLITPWVRKLLRFNKAVIGKLMVPVYRLTRKTRLRNFLILLLVPAKFKPDARRMEEFEQKVLNYA